MIVWLEEQSRRLHLEITLVFDGQRECDAFGSQFLSVKIFHSSSGQSADELLVDIVEHTFSSHNLCVVTSDRAVQQHCLALGATISPVKDFFNQVKERKSAPGNSEKSSQWHASSITLKMMQELFEKRWKELYEDDDDF